MQRGDAYLPSSDGHAKGLGWASIGLGLTQILSPRFVARSIGIRDAAPAATRMVGARELVCGIGLLSSTRPAVWLWARVVGDVIDLGILGRALQCRRVEAPKVMASMTSVAGILALDVVAAIRFTQDGRTIPVEAASARTWKVETVQRPSLHQAGARPGPAAVEPARGPAQRLERRYRAAAKRLESVLAKLVRHAKPAR